MPFVKLNLKDTKEPEIVAEGEYNLRVVKVNDTESKKGNPMTVLTIRIEDAGIPNVQPVMHYINYPTPDTPPEQVQMRNLEIKRLLEVFGVAYDDNGFDSQDLQGASCTCMLTQEEGDDEIVRNRLRLPRLRE